MEKNVLDDIRFFQKPNNWPRWPMLPLKKRNGKHHEPEFFAVALEQSTPPFEIHTGPSMYRLPELSDELKKEGVAHPTWRQVFDKAGARKIEYATLEELFQIWEID